MSAKHPSTDAEEPNRTLLHRKPRGCGGIFFVLVVVLAAFSGGALGAFMWLLEGSQTHIEALETFRPKIGSKLWSADGELLGEFTTEARQLIPLNEIPLHVQKAFIATEDDTFYQHKGVRPDAIVNSVLYGVRTGHIRGASTITMQVVRNVEDLRVGTEQTMKRKINEAINALQVEREFTKDEILELYLNQIFLGGSAHGVEAASWQYYGKSCRELTLAEGATLAGLTRSPNVNRPDRQPENARQRRNIVLRQMLDNEFITHEEYEAAQAEALEDSVLTPEKRATMMARREGLWAPNRFKAPYFKEEVQRLIIQNGWSDNEELFEGGLDIKTTIDMRLQRAAEEAMDAALGEFDAKRLESLQKSGRENEFVPVAGALVCLDNRRGMEGYVRAMVGGRDFEKSKFNTATQAKRQPGSSVKPFVWAVALDNGMTASDIVVDEPYVRMDGAGNRWAPQNFSGDFAGPVTLRVALQNSINIVSVKLVERFGMPLVRQCLRDAGIETPVDNVVGLTIGLGTPVVTVLEQCTAYSTFAKGGVRAAPAFVTEIKDRDGFLRHRNQIRLIPGAIKEDVAYAMTYLMEGVATWGTGARSSRLNRPRAGKTGTSNDSRDAWFCAYTPDYTCVVWVGYLDNRPLGRGRDYTGGRLACPIWTDFMIKAQEGLPVKEFMPPPGVEFHQVDKSSGLAGGSLREVFIRGTKPPSRAPEPEEELLEVVSPEEAMEAGELEAL